MANPTVSTCRAVNCPSDCARPRIAAGSVRCGSSRSSSLPWLAIQRPTTGASTSHPGSATGVPSAAARPSNRACASVASAQPANTSGASTNTVRAPVNSTAAAPRPTRRATRAAKLAYSGQLAVAITQAASRASMKSCTTHTDRAMSTPAWMRPGVSLFMRVIVATRAPRVVSDRSRLRPRSGGAAPASNPDRSATVRRRLRGSQALRFRPWS